MAYIFQQLAKQASMQGIDPKNVVDARTWFRMTAMQVSVVNAPKVIGTADPFTLLTSLSPGSIGKMYCFFYDAKTKNELPYWDKFPLIFPIEMYSDGFLGINLHYISPIMRAKLMNALYDTLNNNKYDKTTKLKISYQVLKNVSRFSLFEPCIKRYLFSHVRSKFMYISPERWDMAAMLPMERFVKKTKQHIFKDSVRGM